MPARKLFICIPWFFPAYKAGGPVQSIVNMANELNEGYELNIFTSDSDLNNEVLIGVEINRWVQFNSYTKVWYSGNANRSNNLLKKIEEIKPDVLYIVGLFSWHFNIVPLLFGKAPKKILSVRGMLHEGALTQKKLKKKIFLQVFKFLRSHRDIVFHASDEDEGKHIGKWMGKNAAIKVAGNFSRMIAKRTGYSKDPEMLHLITIALISPMKNHLQILESLTNSKANIRYSIYGPIKDNSYWQDCLEKISQLPSNINVIYYGVISSELVPETLYTADVFIMPSKSENYGHSIIEALHAGLPVITSKHTPWNQLKENKAGINVSTSGNEILHAIESFVSMNSNTYNEWSDAAAVYATKKVDIGKLKIAYKILFS